MPQQDDTTIELISLDRQISDLRAELAARDAEILRLKQRVNALIDDKERLTMLLEAANSVIRDVY
ncbi:MAG: hypothetical protein KDE45_02825 [Caldilineaceae bacterium]|nr:hypothetical protein [Caldilineaceae bacterium]